MKYHWIGKFMLLLCFVAWLFPSETASDAKKPLSSEQTYLYKTTFIRAAPGKLLDLIDLLKDQMSVYDASGDKRPFWWRHTQGDQWDLMMLYPMKSYTEYYSKERIKRRAQAQDSSSISQLEFKKRFQEDVSWYEDIFVMGPPLEIVENVFEDTSFYHCEIFIALPGKHTELFKQREMENAYLYGIGRPQNLIFTRDQGAAWDLFTLGCYKDMKEWAASSDIPREKREAAAIEAGFEGSDKIGPYMRTLILMHRDTIGNAIK
ncbi:MAG: hypothetical protein JSV17_11715 [Candidatus Aminicenantes bacterium]|nr:MAG: hypothetical protein JSV17_11715 [Candidatus Aminicenantes bacterium]